MLGGSPGRCLQTTEAGGMGEGWSDAFAEYVVINYDIYARGMSHFVVLNT